MKRDYTRIAVLFPPYGLIHNELCRLAGERGAEAVIFRVSAGDAPVDPESFVGNPDANLRTLRTMGALGTLRRAAAETTTVYPDVVAWACTSGSFIGDGLTLDTQVDVMREAAGVPATTTSVAIIHALRRRNLVRVCVLTPYVREVGEPFIGFLESHGVEVLAHGHAGRVTDEEIGMLTIDDFAPLVKAVWRPGAEAIVIPCTAVRAGTIAEGLGAACGVPVILANPATLDHAVELARNNHRFSSHRADVTYC